MSKKPKISVIIPTYKRPKLLFNILKSLQKQTFTDFEIILIDNAADPKVKKIVNQFNKKARILVKYEAEPILGWHNAAHRGTKAAKGKLLLFTTDDIEFTPGCLAAYVEMFDKYPQMKAAGGPIKPKWEEEPPKWVKNLIGGSKVFPPFSLMEPFDSFHLSKDIFFFGANMVVRKKEFFKVGGFNPEDFADIRLGDGELGLNRKITKKGWLIGYIPKALVYHFIPKKRMSLEAFYHWMENAGAIEMYTLFHERGIPKHWFDFIAFTPAILRINLKYWVGNLFFKSPKADLRLKFKLQYVRTKAQFVYINRIFKDKNLRKLIERKRWLI